MNLQGRPVAGTRQDGLPLFPLNTVLFPEGSLGLQIFEVRYLDMIGRCHKTGAPFGVVPLTQGHEVRTRGAGQSDGFAPEAFADVGTLAHIVEFATPQPGLMVIRCAGSTRFRIHARRQLPHGLWLGDIEHLPEDPATPVPEDLLPVAHALGRLLEQAQEQEAQSPFELPAYARPYRLDDCAWVANRWCELLSMPAAMKQSLLQLDSPLLRLELVGDLLTNASAA